MSIYGTDISVLARDIISLKSYSKGRTHEMYNVHNQAAVSNLEITQN